MNAAAARHWGPAVGGCGLLLAAVLLAPDEARAAAAQDWPPFVLVAGLLLVGLVADGDRLFAAGGHLLTRLCPNGLLLYAGTAVLVVAVTTLLNLDTSVTFLTPVLVYAARSRGGREEAPLLYACLLLSNAGSLLLPGSNLTNLIVLGHLHLSGARLPRPHGAASTGGRRSHRTRRRCRAPSLRCAPPPAGEGSRAPGARRRPRGHRTRHGARPGVACARPSPWPGSGWWRSLLRSRRGGKTQGTRPGMPSGGSRRSRPGGALRPCRGAGHARAVMVGSRHPALPSRRRGTAAVGASHQRAREQPSRRLAPGGPSAVRTPSLSSSGSTSGRTCSSPARWPGSCGCGRQRRPVVDPT